MAKPKNNKIDSFNEYIDNWNAEEQEITEHKKTTIAFSPNLIASSSINWEILGIWGILGISMNTHFSQLIQLIGKYWEY